MYQLAISDYSVLLEVIFNNQTITHRYVCSKLINGIRVIKISGDYVDKTIKQLAIENNIQKYILEQNYHLYNSSARYVNIVKV